MSFIENFWEAHGDVELTFVDLEEERLNLTASEAHRKLSELDNDSLELNSNEEFLRNSIEGRLNFLVGNFSREYFDSYKGKRFKVRYSMHEGSDLYSIICFANQEIWSFQTDDIDGQYTIFKEKIDEGRIK